uniref:Uncharacterized protein n=1 Tax=Arundo donax TaxID=35708 RepID=A0A0A8YBB9_ARUDO
MHDNVMVICLRSSQIAMSCRSDSL